MDCGLGERLDDDCGLFEFDSEAEMDDRVIETREHTDQEILSLWRGTKELGFEHGLPVPVGGLDLLAEEDLVVVKVFLVSEIFGELGRVFH